MVQHTVSSFRSISHCNGYFSLGEKADSCHRTVYKHTIVYRIYASHHRQPGIVFRQGVWNVLYIDNLLERIQKRIQYIQHEEIQLHVFNAYDIIGHSEYGLLEHLIQEADHRMYEIKKARKRQAEE